MRTGRRERRAEIQTGNGVVAAPAGDLSAAVGVGAEDVGAGGVPVEDALGGGGVVFVGVEAEVLDAGHGGELGADGVHVDGGGEVGGELEEERGEGADGAHD